MKVGIPEVVLSILLVVIPLASIVNWCQACLRWRTGKPILPAEQRDAVPWGLADLALTLLFVVLVVGLGATTARQTFDIPATTDLELLTPGQQSIVFGAFGAASLLATFLSLGYLHMRWRGVLNVHGLDFALLRYDLGLGLCWFTMLAVPVLLLQLALTQWFPTKHPLVEMLRESGNTTLLPAAAFSAVIAAPVFEESFFRLIVQGWLEKLFAFLGQPDPDGQLQRGVLVGGTIPLRPGSPPADFSASSSAAEDEAMGGLREHAESPNTAGDVPVSWIPILASAGFFSLAHVGHGPDWLPLFFLALGLGYLYQRTGRIQSCIVVHVLLNALGVLQLWAAVRQQ